MTQKFLSIKEKIKAMPFTVKLSFVALILILVVAGIVAPALTAGCVGAVALVFSVVRITTYLMEGK